jgi:transcriptional regulator with XRE-family HTH domain
MKTSEKIKIARKNKGLTQKELAIKAGAAQATINKIESDEIKNPSFDLAIKIAAALETDVFDLFCDEAVSNAHFEKSKKEIDRMKVLVLHSLDKYESNQIFLKQFEHNQEVAEDWKKFEEFKSHLLKFKTGVLEKLIEVGFCSHDDINEYRAYVLKKSIERTRGV